MAKNIHADRYVVDISPAERRRTATLVRVKKLQNKGLGVVAAKNIPAYTLVGTYPGERFTASEYGKRRERGLTDGKFAVDFWKPDVAGSARSGYVIDPGSHDGTLLPRFKHAVAPLVNEPDHRAAPNLIWVWNLPKYSLQLYTLVPVAKGQELTLCYGHGGYVRDYTTSCVTRPGEVEPELHVVTRPGARPVPFASLGNVGVRHAVRALGRHR